MARYAIAVALLLAASCAEAATETQLRVAREARRGGSRRALLEGALAAAPAPSLEDGLAGAPSPEWVEVPSPAPPAPSPAQGPAPVPAPAPAPAPNSKRALPGSSLDAGNASTVFVPAGGAGSWQSGGDTGAIFIHGNLMDDGTVIGWGSTDLQQSQGLFPSAIYTPSTRSSEQLLGDCGVGACKNAFCAGQAVTMNSEILIFGGHGEDPVDLEWFRRYDHHTQSVTRQKMPSPRWYPTPMTMPDGRILVVGGVPDAGDAGYDGITRADDAKPAKDNPTYTIYDPDADSFSEDRYDMEDQLHGAHPINTYPFVILTPDGGVAVSSGKTLMRYSQTDYEKFEKQYEYPNRPGPPWSYPQTGTGVPLPMFPPHDQMRFIAIGGSSDDYAGQDTPASDKAEVIDLTAGESASWQSVGPMPQKRIMGDAVIMCDGRIGVFNGAGKGIGGWNENEDQTWNFKDGTSFDCVDRCSMSHSPVYEPTIYDPATGTWTAKGSLAEAQRPRLYHSNAILLPDCRVMVSGSDVTGDNTAEIYTPPYLSQGPRPVIASVTPDAPIVPGATLTVTYTSTDPVARALLIRSSAVTHSLHFDARALWLTVATNVGGVMTVQTPASSNKLPPGMYWLTVLTSKDVPAALKLVRVMPTPAAPADSSS